MNLHQLVLFSPEMSKCHNYDLKPAKWDTSQEQQKQRLALTTSQPGENGTSWFTFVSSKWTEVDVETLLLSFTTLFLFTSPGEQALFAIECICKLQVMRQFVIRTTEPRILGICF